MEPSSLTPLPAHVRPPASDRGHAPVQWGETVSRGHLADAPFDRTPLRVAMVSTHAPRQCGIATFTADLAAAVEDADPGIRVSWVAIDDEDSAHSYGPEVGWRIRQKRIETYGRAAEALNASDVDVVCVQHEFGLFGIWGDPFEDHFRPFLETIEKPLVTTFHTVLPNPSPSVRAAVRRIGARSDAVMAMAARARTILEDQYGLDPEKIHVIPHGVPNIDLVDREAVKTQRGLSGRRVISTFGLLDPRKGLEYMIEAMVEVARRHPDALYVILGRTHPELVRRSGEQYRTGLVRLVHAHGLEQHVSFVDEYLSQADIMDYLVASDVYVTPYLDPNQITSGTLSYAIGAGKAIVSTPYAHAVEALAAERGLMVDFRSADALAEAVNSILDSDDLRLRLERNAGLYGSEMAWPAVGRDTSLLYRAVVRDRKPRQPLLARIA